MMWYEWIIPVVFSQALISFGFWLGYKYANETKKKENNVLSFPIFGVDYAADENVIFVDDERGPSPEDVIKAINKHLEEGDIDKE